MKTLLTFLCLVHLPFLARAEEMTDSSFDAMLENATLEDTWAPVAGDQGGANPLRPRAFGGKGAGGMKNRFPGSRAT